MLPNAGPCSVTCHYGGSYSLQSSYELLKIDPASSTVWTATLKDSCREQTVTKLRRTLIYNSLKKLEKLKKKENYLPLTCCNAGKLFWKTCTCLLLLRLSPCLKGNQCPHYDLCPAACLFKKYNSASTNQVSLLFPCSRCVLLPMPGAELHPP